ncbi:hypothetical protein BDD12DRAFT_891566 [Trichophaea hybrida]|nr:hypothetical protein BDD12DRAFT_891566 [Trichophaea hybrida]
MITLTWGTTPLALLPPSTLTTHLPHLTPPRRSSAIDIRSKLSTSQTDYFTHPPERYRKAATAILQYFETLTDPDPATHNPLTRFLERKIAAEDTDGDPGKTLRAVETVLHIARAFGCLPSLRLVLEHFLLTFGRQLSGYGEDWRDVLGEIGSHGAVRGEIEARMNEPGGTEMSTSVVGGGKAFEAAAGPELGRVWRGERSIFAVASPEVLQGVLMQLGSGNTLIPPGVTAEGELLDGRSDWVCVEIRKVEAGRGAEGRLKQRVVDWFSRGRWDGGGGRREVLW